MNKKKNRHLSRKMRHGGYATAMIVAVIAVVIVLNIIVGILADMYSLTLDLTTSQTYALSDEVKPYVQENQKDVQIYVLSMRSIWRAIRSWYSSTQCSRNSCSFRTS